MQSPISSLFLSPAHSLCSASSVLYFAPAVTGLFRALHCSVPKPEGLLCLYFKGGSLCLFFLFFFSPCEFDSALLWVTVTPAEPPHTIWKKELCPKETLETTTPTTPWRCSGLSLMCIWVCRAELPVCSPTGHLAGTIPGFLTSQQAQPPPQPQPRGLTLLSPLLQPLPSSL